MVLTSFLLILFFGMDGDSAARFDVILKIENELTEIIQDETRRLGAIDVIEDMKVVVNKQHAEYSEIQTHFVKISADYKTTKQQYDNLDIKVDDFWRTTMKQQVDSRFALRDRLTREEWKKLYKEII
jgi:hypothetical protein